MTNKITVNLQDRSYEICIGANVINNLTTFLAQKKYSKIVIITDENVYNIYQEYLNEVLKNNYELVVVKAQEQSKSFAVLEDVCEKILQLNIDRNSVLIAFGGGVVGDLTGFVASILLRGIDFIQVPTTLLAMVDSSVGGKTAINAKAGKNLIGSFYQPKLVVCELNFLASLPKRELTAGYAEVVKYGLIYDQNFYNYLQKNYLRFFNQEQDVLLEVVKKCCEIKALIVSADEKESSGLRAILNFGHTFGHLFEAELNYSNAMLHGEAVAIGMMMATKLSQNLGLISESNFIELVNHLKQCGFELDLKKYRQEWSINNLKIHLYKDKKIADQKLVFVLLKEIGCAIVKKDLAIEEFEKVVNYFLKN